MRQVLEMVGLWERRSGQVLTFSGGMRRRLEIARGLMHSPRVLFLDEPTIGLDPQTRRSIWSYIQQLQESEDITIFMTTHYMDEAEFCDRIAIMDQEESSPSTRPRRSRRRSARTGSGSRLRTTRQRSRRLGSASPSRGGSRRAP
jgi:ABC-type multidrug transport system ATPase subunit